jgi:hypothetical protein
VSPIIACPEPGKKPTARDLTTVARFGAYLTAAAERGYTSPTSPASWLDADLHRMFPEHSDRDHVVIIDGKLEPA